MYRHRGVCMNTLDIIIGLVLGTIIVDVGHYALARLTLAYHKRRWASIMADLEEQESDYDEEYEYNKD